MTFYRRGLLQLLTDGEAVNTQAAQDHVNPVAPLASHAGQHERGIIELMNCVHAEHPALVKTMSGAALTIALAKMAERQPA